MSFTNLYYKREWEEKQKRKVEREKEKEKDREDKEKDKDDDKDKKEKKSTPSKSSQSSVSPPLTTKSAPAHERYALHRDIFAMRQTEHRRRRQAAQAKDLAPRFPGAPRGELA
ncbi:hypothetical protein IW261DRAFT_1413074 [Armillaria novae-zelandiae]|uniref:Uncharacterized protein n=1 Tax=Armillaria novae-zelandiae TaxID=153914 RepID=A0AA39UNL2_9AGAR|nr:hypothetical protein IW261DRAFT_1413074 [Armillaria novae-zelandiae]